MPHGDRLRRTRTCPAFPFPLRVSVPVSVSVCFFVFGRVNSPPEGLRPSRRSAPTVLREPATASGDADIGVSDETASATNAPVATSRSRRIQKACGRVGDRLRPFCGSLRRRRVMPTLAFRTKLPRPPGRHLTVPSRTDGRQAMGRVLQCPGKRDIGSDARNQHTSFAARNQTTRAAQQQPVRRTIG